MKTSMRCTTPVAVPFRRARHSHASLSLLLAAMATACGDAPDTAPSRVGPGPLADTVWIGAVEGDGPDVFGSISALAVDARGAVHVFDGTAFELRTFGPDGAFRSKHGRRGSGPGEFQHVIGMAVTPESAIWLVDGANARYTVLDQGTVRTHPRGAGVYDAAWVGGYAHGHLHDVVLLPGQRTTEALVRVDSSGIAIDTFHVPRSIPPVPRIGSIRLPLPYAPEALQAFDPKGTLWRATTHEYALHEVSLSGDTIRVLRRDVPPRPLSDTEADSLARYLQSLRSEFQLDVPDAMVPRNAPLIRHLLVGDDGSLWVTRSEAGDGSTRFDVFDAGGEFLGEVVVGMPLRLRAVQNGRLYGIATDDSGAERIFSARFRPVSRAIQ